MIRAFTLIELLVVITILVVLLALLTPAMDRAIYVTELTTCAARLDSIALGAVTYAFENKRRYLHRPGVEEDADAPIIAYRPNTINDSIGHDDRPLLATFLSVNKNLNCPLNKDVDLAGPPAASIVESDYNLWFGFSYPGTGGMKKVGDLITWDGYRFNVLADDYDLLYPQGNDVQSTHFDHDGVMTSVAQEDVVITLSRWVTDRRTVQRGPMDRNFAFDDGSVGRLENLVVRPGGGLDDRVKPLPPFAVEGDTNNYKNSLPPKH